jgi:hypothetical protein
MFLRYALVVGGRGSCTDAALALHSNCIFCFYMFCMCASLLLLLLFVAATVESADVCCCCVCGAPPSAVVFISLASPLDAPQNVLLSCSLAVLLGGMVFQSAALDAGSAGYVLLTVLVACTIVAAVFLFVWMLAVETRRTCRRNAPGPRHHHRAHATPTLPSDCVWTPNPLPSRALLPAAKATGFG